MNEEKTKSFAVSKQKVYNSYLRVCDKKGGAGIDKESIEMFNADLRGTTSQMTIEFSDKMDKRYRNFEFGPMGESNALKIKKFIDFSEDGETVTFEIEIKPNQHYQILVGDRFRNESGVSLKPYLIDITTANK